MSLLQAALETYNSQQMLVGVSVAGQQTLSPISHAFQNARIELSLDENGAFVNARALAKAEGETIIPVTELSLNRTGDNSVAHPLSDQLRYLAPFGGEKYAAYLRQLTAWAESDCSHPKVRAILQYIQGGTILSDLAAWNILQLDADGAPTDGKIEGTEYAKCLVRWRVLTAHESPSACWEDASLFDSFIRFYENLRRDAPCDRCLVSGEMDIPALFHPKGVLTKSNSAKLISANDSSGFTYRGRFTEAAQAANVGYTATQRAHAALRWLAANHGVDFGGRTFFWWTPQCDDLPSLNFLGYGPSSEQKADLPNFRRELLSSLSGYKKAIPPQETVVIAALDAATTGRLSVTYYNELRSSDFLDRLEHWYQTCVWMRYGQEWSPALRMIALSAFGVERDGRLDADDRLIRDQVQRLLSCVIDRASIPADMVQALAIRASQPQAYSPANRDIVLSIACAIIRKYRNDKFSKEEWTLALDENNCDRSYLYGRLLAVAEQVERCTYDKQEGREPNAIRLQSVFSQRPVYGWRVLSEKLISYYARLNPGLRAYYRRITDDIINKMDAKDRELNKRLDDTYLFGYSHQREAFYIRKETVTVSDTTNGGNEE